MFLLGWIFIPLFIFVAKLVEIIETEFISELSQETLWFSRILMFAATMLLVAINFWNTYEILVGKTDVVSGLESAFAMLCGVLGFVIVPRVEALLLRKIRRR
jgi:hypothetical protein